MNLQNYFYTIADYIQTLLKKDHVFTCTFSGEESDFARFNQGKIRQAGHVKQSFLNLNLIHGKKHVLNTLGLSGVLEDDKAKLKKLIQTETDKLAQTLDDPFLLYATEVHSSELIKPNYLPNVLETTKKVLKTVQDLDFVGIFAAGSIHRGFANSFGQKNWLSSHSFNLDFSVYLHSDKAVKSDYAGFEWNQTDFENTIERVKEKLKILNQPAKTIKPGQYRTFLTSTAFNDILNLLSWGGFSEKSLRSKQSALLKLQTGEESLHPSFTLSENTKAGIGPLFQADGFAKPDQVNLITEGKLKNCLISPRTAKEYNIETNGSNAAESPESLNVAAGNIEDKNILKTLDTGLYVNNLWYLNYSDRPAARMTGMTRFATFWVENGQITTPLNVMRFDDSLYSILGKKLVGFTKERELLIDSSTYEERSTTSAYLPGLLIDGFNLTL